MTINVNLNQNGAQMKSQKTNIHITHQDPNLGGFNILLHIV
jgi:hypothetical protein